MKNPTDLLYLSEVAFVYLPEVTLGEKYPDELGNGGGGKKSKTKGEKIFRAVEGVIWLNKLVRRAGNAAFSNLCSGFVGALLAPETTGAF